MTLLKTFSTDGGLTWSFPEVIYESSEIHLCEPGRPDQLVHLCLRATTHDPWFAVPVDARSGDLLELRMPWLAGVEQVAARLYQARKALQ